MKCEHNQNNRAMVVCKRYVKEHKMNKQNNEDMLKAKMYDLYYALTLKELDKRFNAVKVACIKNSSEIGEKEIKEIFTSMQNFLKAEVSKGDQHWRKQVIEDSANEAVQYWMEKNGVKVRVSMLDAINAMLQNVSIKQG